MCAIDGSQRIDIGQGNNLTRVDDVLFFEGDNFDILVGVVCDGISAVRDGDLWYVCWRFDDRLGVDNRDTIAPIGLFDDVTTRLDGAFAVGTPRVGNIIGRGAPRLGGTVSVEPIGAAADIADARIIG